MSTIDASAQDNPDPTPAPVVKRSVMVAEHRTSISIEEPFWRAAKALAVADRISMSAWLTRIDRRRPPGANLSSAVRLHVLKKYQEAANPRP